MPDAPDYTHFESIIASRTQMKPTKRRNVRKLNRQRERLHDLKASSMTALNVAAKSTINVTWYRNTKLGQLTMSALALGR